MTRGTTSPATSADERDLRQQDDRERNRQAGQLPQLQRHEREREEERQRYAAQIVERLLRQPENAERIVEVADHGGDQHRADVGRQRPARDAIATLT